jgi:hypothetical protein
VQADAAFCGQCGHNLHSNMGAGALEATVVGSTTAPDMPVEVPPLVTPDPMLELLQPDSLGLGTPSQPPVSSTLPPTVVAAAPAPVPSIPEPEPAPVPSIPEPEPAPVPSIPEPEPVAPPVTEPEPVAATIPEPEPAPVQPPEATFVNASRTQLQQVVARLFHVQSNQEIELPQNLSVVHIGKPNDRIPPDIDVAGFSNSEIVSRIHADIRVEGDAHYIEDVGSSNGTYINNLPLLPGNRHRLRPGDRISLGKGDLMTFLFQLS